MKEIYLDIMEKAVCAYTEPVIREYIETVRREGITEHGYPRLTADIGVLTAHGRLTHWKGLFVELMDLCCAQMPVVFDRPDNRNAGNEFSVKEIVMCLMTLEKYNAYPEKIESWKAAIRGMDPYKSYAHIAPVPAVPMHNWAAFAAVSEQLRIYAGLGHETSAAFVDNQVASQLFSFDENGMYRDPNEPMVYDLTTRLQLSMTLRYGYDGKNSAALRDFLTRGREETPWMQSVTGEIPYGGRSAQFLHNEPTFAALFEYDALCHKENGDMKKARQCRHSAMQCAQATIKWLDADHLWHVKNRYEPDSGYGCEAYGYFLKYMVTVASFAHFAYLMADDSIEPAEDSAYARYIHRTGEHFHKTFIRFGEYFLEYDTHADFHYDSNGLGRIHRRGAPSAICLSLPFTPTPNYGLDLTNPGAMSLCGGLISGDREQYACEKGAAYELMSHSVDEQAARLLWKVTLPDGGSFTEECTVTEDGVVLKYACEDEISVMLPVFETDGWLRSDVECSGSSACVRYEGWQCRYESDAPLHMTDEVYANRNGHYRLMLARGKGGAQVKIAIEQG